MNEPLPLLQFLTPAQVLLALENNAKVFACLPFSDLGKPNCFRVDAIDYPYFKSLLEQDPDKEDAETFFYLDFDKDLVLDPTAEL